MRDPNINDPDKLESYNGPGAIFPEYVDTINSRKVMQAQFDLIKKQQQEIIEVNKYREENRKAAKHSKKRSIATVVIAILTLIATLIGWFI